jgi:DNA-binding NtrC family response regulator
MSKVLKSEIVPVANVPLPDGAEDRRPVVLVVDDERVIADTLAAILSQSGFAPLVAYNGKSAMEIARVIPPELLISDVVMPGMTGIELAIALVGAVPDCKVLLFSGQASTVDLLVDARAAGHNFTTLAKPIHPTELLANISRCLEVEEPDTSDVRLRA